MTQKFSSEYEYYGNIKQRVESVRYRMNEAAVKAGRAPEEIILVGVTKTQSAKAVRALIMAGVTNIGENRVQEILEKEEYIADLPHKTHMIGHLQRNKAKMLFGHIDMMQSLASLQTLEVLERVYENAQKPLDVLVEVNIGGEESKSGISADMAIEFCERVMQSTCLRLRGLMAIPPFCPQDEVRGYFAQMRRLFVDIRGKKMDNNSIDVLSMGMSSDFEAAIAEGATMVRVGTELFGPRI